MTKRLALLCGIARYNDETVGNLPAVEHELMELRAAFEQFHEAHTYRVEVLQNDQLTIEGLNRKLEELAHSSELDEVFFYLAGHGTVRNEKTYFHTYGAPTYTPGIRLDELYYLLNTICKRCVTIAVLDFCYAGAIIDAIPGEPEQLALLASATRSQEAEAQKGPSFTRNLTRALLGQAADETGYVRWGRVVDTVCVAMELSFVQRPVNRSSHLTAHPVNRVAVGTRAGATASGGRVGSGLPEHRRVSNDSPEPFTTRAALAEVLRSRVRDLMQSGARILVLEQPPGWGKTFALAKVLGDLSVPVRFVDLGECDDSHQIADRLLSSFSLSSSLREDEYRRIDRSPSIASQIVAEVAVGGGRFVVIFENVHRNASGSPPAALEFFVRSLADAHALVIIESYRRLSLLDKFHQAATVNAGQLPRLDDAEQREWAERFLRRALDGDEEAAIALCGGHPGVTRQVLEAMVRDQFVDCDIVAGASDLERYIDAFSRTGCVEKGLADSIDDKVWAWLAMLPDARVIEAELGVGAKAIRQAALLGLVVRDGSAWVAAPWGRVLAFRHCRGRPSAVDASWEQLLAIATKLPAAAGSAQRRHAMTAGIAIGLGKERLAEFLRAIPTEPPPVDEDAAVQVYEPPAPAAVIHALIAPDVGASRLPMDEFIWALDGAARRGDAAAINAMIRELDSSALSDWRVVKAVHRALIESSNSNKLDLYRHVISSLDAPAGDALAVVACRAWCMRLLVAGARYAWTSAAFAEAQAWQAKAEAVALTLTEPESESARRLRADSFYRLALLRANMADRLQTLLEAHRAALSTIPPVAEWGERAWMWGKRAMRHLKPVLRTDPNVDANLKLLGAAFDALPPMIDKFIEAERYLDDASELPPAVVARVHAAVLRDAALLRADGPYTRTLCRIARLLTDGALASRCAASWGEEAAASLSIRWDPEQAYLFRACLGRVAHTPKPRSLAETSEGLLRTLHQFRTDADDEQLEDLRVACLRQVALHKLGDDAGHVIDRAIENPAEAKLRLVALANAERRIDGAYRTHVNEQADAWLVADWTRWKITVARRRNACHRVLSKKERDAAVAAQTKVLREFVLAREGALGACPAMDVAALYVARYIWNVDEMRTRVRRLVRCTVPARHRARVVRDVVDIWSMYVLLPRPLTLPENRPMPEDIEIFVSAIAEFAMLGAGVRVRAAIALVSGFVRDACDPNAWQQLADDAERLLGRPDEYWARLSRAAQQPSEAGQAIGMAASMAEELTDARTLILVGELLRYGCAETSLPMDLRARLGELSVVAMFDAMAWQRGNVRRLEQRNAIAPRMRRGTAVALALSASSDGLLFGSPNSPLTNRRGEPMSWRELALQDLADARNVALGEMWRIVDYAYATTRDLLASR